MKTIQILTWVVSVCVVGVVMSFAGALYTARQTFVQANKPQTSFLPTPAQ